MKLSRVLFPAFFALIFLIIFLFPALPGMRLFTDSGRDGILPVAELQASEGKGKCRGAKPTAYPSWFKLSFLDFKEDIEDARKRKKRLMVIYTRRGCPYCNALVERNLKNRRIQKKVRRYFDVIALNLWGDKETAYTDGKSYTEKTLGKKLKIQFTPTVLFFDEKGKIILRLNGYLPPPEFSSAICPPGLTSLFARAGT